MRDEFRDVILFGKRYRWEAEGGKLALFPAAPALPPPSPLDAAALIDFISRPLPHPS